MLYATTRDSEGNYTAQWALTRDRGPDGGFFVPYHPPYFYQANLKELREKSFLQTEAELLNTLFGTKIGGWDLAFAGGPCPVHMEKIGRRTLTAERWRNTDWNFSGYVRQISLLLGREGEYSTWAEIGVGIAVLFAMVLELQKKELLPKGEELDVAVSAENLNAAVSCLYAKAWGLPLGRVVCGCRESKGLWQLLHDGEMYTDVLEPDSETVDGLENLLMAESYQAEVRRFLNCVKRGKPYVPADSLLRKLREDVGVSVISEKRRQETIPGVYSTKHYLLSCDGAGAYAGLLDFRAAGGSGNKGLVLCDRSPLMDLDRLSEGLAMEPEQLKKWFAR